MRCRLEASTLLTVGRIDGMGISRRLRDVTCQSLLTALLRGVGSRRRGLTLLGSLDPVYGPSEPRGKTTPPKPGGAWHIHSTNTYRCGWVGEKSYCVMRCAIAEAERERGGERRERSRAPHAVCWRESVQREALTRRSQLRHFGTFSGTGGGVKPAHAPTLPDRLARWGTMLGACEGRVGTSAAMHGACFWDYETMLGVGE